jgi:hypothetical protein
MHEPTWREFSNAERAQLREGDAVAVRVPGENNVRTATFLSWFRWGAKIRFEGETDPDFVGPFSLGPCP